MKKGKKPQKFLHKKLSKRSKCLKYFPKTLELQLQQFIQKIRQKTHSGEVLSTQPQINHKRTRNN